MKLNERSLRNLEGVHPDLVRVVHRAAELSPVPFVVTEGLRNLERQKMLVAAGKSWTLNSRHLNGMAVDVVDADDFGYDMPDLMKIAAAFKQAAAELKVPIVWGGDWKQRDTPHFELDRKAYPDDALPTSTKIAEATKAAAKSPVTAVGTGAAAGGAAVSIPSPPDLTGVSAWHGFGKTLADLGSWAVSHPLITFGLGAWVVSLIFWTQIKAAWAEWRAS